MKKLVLSLMFFLVSSFGYSINLNGTYLTEDYNTQSVEGLIKVTYTFTNDSLYIDVYPSGCSLTAMSLKKSSNNEYIAVETLYDINTNKILQKSIYHLEFLPCVWDKHSLAVYRDGTIVDIIKKIK